MARSSAARPVHLRHPAVFLALGFGSGLVPAAPGTAGTLVGVGLFAACADAWPDAMTAVTFAIALIGIPLCDVAARRLGVHDDPAIVWDEIAGYFVAMAGLPLEPLWLLLAFALFRAFDVAKPWPIRWADRRLHGGLGIMVDDLLAGAATCGILQALAGVHALTGLSG